MKTFGYLRVSTGGQTVESQRLAIYDAGYRIDEWVEVVVSSKKTTVERRIDELLAKLSPGDKVVVAELSRLGRSVGQISILAHKLIQGQIGLHCLKEGINIDGTMNIQTKVMVTMFSLFAEIERDLISERTKEGLNRAVSEGKKLGRPKGAGRSKIDSRATDVAEWERQGVSVASMAKMLGVSWTTVDRWLKLKGSKTL